MPDSLPSSVLSYSPSGRVICRQQEVSCTGWWTGLRRLTGKAHAAAMHIRLPSFRLDARLVTSGCGAAASSSMGMIRCRMMAARQPTAKPLDSSRMQASLQAGLSSSAGCRLS